MKDMSVKLGYAVLSKKKGSSVKGKSMKGPHSVASEALYEEFYLAVFQFDNESFHGRIFRDLTSVSPSIAAAWEKRDKIQNRVGAGFNPQIHEVDARLLVIPISRADLDNYNQRMELKRSIDDAHERIPLLSNQSRYLYTQTEPVDLGEKFKKLVEDSSLRQPLIGFVPLATGPTKRDMVVPDVLGQNQDCKSCITHKTLPAVLHSSIDGALRVLDAAIARQPQTYTDLFVAAVTLKPAAHALKPGKIQKLFVDEVKEALDERGQKALAALSAPRVG